jgi:hypothetical protein
MMVIRKGAVFYGHEAGVKPVRDLYEDILFAKNEEVHL